MNVVCCWCVSQRTTLVVPPGWANCTWPDCRNGNRTDPALNDRYDIPTPESLADLPPDPT